MVDLETVLSDLKAKEGIIANPFDDVTYGNFWFEKHHQENVDSIHQPAFQQIEYQLNLLIKDKFRQTKTILLTGDAGCGKSHLLGRLKDKLNSSAYFVYIQPIEDYRYFWRHTLQYTVTSLMQIPEGEKQSQLQLWLKSLPVLNSSDWVERLLGEKRAFIRHLKNSYPVGIVEAKKFFTALYQLTTDNYDLACEWLAGEDLDEEDLQILGLNKSIDNERLARGILSNFGRITDATKPIIICFDQIERAFSNVFNVNTTFHNERLVNFLVLISITQENWQTYKRTMVQSDLARINKNIFLDDITIEEAEKLWINRLKPLHLQCNPQPNSTIYPLEKKILTDNALGERINLRNALNLGGKFFSEYIENIKNIETQKPNEHDNIPELPTPKRPDFLRKWDQLFAENQQEIKDLPIILDHSDEEFLEIFRYILQCLGVENINPQFLSGVNASKGFTFTCPRTGIKKGLIINNTRNGQSFTALMRKCQEVVNQNRCEQLILIRNVEIPRTGIGAEIYQSLFTPASKQCIHHKLKLEDLHYLFTYQKLYRDADSGDLYINFNPISRQELLSDMLRYKILNNCVSLSSLGLVNCFPERSIFQEKLVNFLPHHTEISFTEIHSQIIADPDFYNCFIPPYFFRNIIFYLYRNQSVINITNPQNIYTQWNVSLLN
ncbi:ATP-binding protein [Cyanobacterium aponinum]|uniref:ATP-binding protein n=1 Tax=Cyanobacterium aponinum TaxID=379064 RepID=UPI000C12D1B2|nr:ATP-binding protein [Cyanobacterium aponinum]PHV61094.1 KAP family P-loop domain-containing protein [Cyanobacterium aponinum IPPAS B-1201]